MRKLITLATVSALLALSPATVGSFGTAEAKKGPIHKSVAAHSSNYDNRGRGKGPKHSKSRNRGKGHGHHFFCPPRENKHARSRACDRSRNHARFCRIEHDHHGCHVHKNKRGNGHYW